MKQTKSGTKARRASAAAVALLFLLLTAGCDINVGIPDFSTPTPTVTGVTLFVSAAEIATGAQFRLSTAPAGEDDFWVCSDEDIASVENGLVTGLKAGTAVVTVSNGREMQSCALTVKEDAVGLKVTGSDANIALGDTLVFETGLPDRVSVEWDTSEPTVATLEEGVFTGIAAGETTVSAAYEEYSDDYTVTVLGGEGVRQLLWADEFDGQTLDGSKWEFQNGVQDVYQNDGKTAYGPMFWGNNELQYYTRDAVTLAEGVMEITAAAKGGLPDGREFTSARIATRDRGYWTYGYFEARMKLPEGAGMWPAFWLLPQPERGMGTQNRYGGWAANGEIDIMEARGRYPYEVGNTVHFGGNPSTYLAYGAKLQSPISEWHTYGLEWRSDHLSWFVDGVETYRVKNTSWHTDSPLGAGNPAAPFDQPFYIVINLAVGGNYDGGVRPDPSFTSAAMEVDYVRVYA